jgi:hypothetical protein
MMKKLLISMWIAPAVISAGTLFGTVTDAQKAPIDAAAVTVWDAATGRGLKATTANGEYSFTGLDAGSYLLKVETAGNALLLGAVQVKEGVGHELNLVMEAPAGARVKARPPYRAPVKDEPVERPKPERFRQAKLLHQVRPVYPALAKKGGITGTVQISTVMRVDGTLVSTNQ